MSFADNRFSRALFILLALLAVPAGAVPVSDPNGSRYDNWSQNAVWSSDYGRYSNLGWSSS